MFMWQQTMWRPLDVRPNMSSERDDNTFFGRALRATFNNVQIVETIFVFLQNAQIRILPKVYIINLISTFVSFFSCYKR